MNNFKDSNDSFEYTYSAPTEEERRSIMSIRQKYEPEANSADTAFERIKKLDARVNGIPTAISLVLGIIGTLIFGGGLTLVLEFGIMLWGIVLMVVGCVPALLAYPAYNYFHEKERAKHADEILRLSDELLKK